jgi:rhodanese-related sulfurtransferase/glutaredoxin
MLGKIKWTLLSLLLSISAFTQTNESDKKNWISADLFSSKIEQQKNPQIFDARSAEEFSLNHVNGAINVNQQDVTYNQVVGKLNVISPVFVYSIGNGRSVALAKDLESRGFKEVYVLDGGIGAWVGAGKPLFTTAKKGLSLEEFNNILASNKVVLVDIGSKYCGSCKKVKPILETLRKEHGNALKIVELELEESPQLIASLKTVTSFPYLILYKEGKTTFKKSGIAELTDALNIALAKTL